MLSRREFFKTIGAAALIVAAPTTLVRAAAELLPVPVARPYFLDEAPYDCLGYSGGPMLVGERFIVGEQACESFVPTSAMLRA